MRLEATAAVVTGGASGLGAATARMLAAEGARVAVFDMDEARGPAVTDEIGGHFTKVDVTDEAAVANAFADAERRNGVARILVCCAGVAPAMKTVGRDGKAHSLDVFRKAVEVNLIGTFAVAARFCEHLARAEPIGEERGVIINTASVAAYDGQVGQAAYAASKAGVVGLTLPLARDLATSCIRVMTIAPGLFLTPMLEGLPPHAQESLGRQAPFPNRLGRPEEYAELIRSIIENPMLNGETIRLDAALRLAPR